MITAFVRFKLPPSVGEADAARLFQGSAPKYKGLSGLVRKYYVFDQSTNTGGGVYLWESREAADRVYTPEWKAMITERYGAPPEIQYFSSPVIVDNTTNEITTVAAE